MSKTTRRRMADWGWIAVGVLAAVLLAWTLTQVQTQADRIDALKEALEDEQSAAEARGETPVAPDPDELIEDPEYRGPKGDPGPPPSDEQVYAAVEAYFEAHPVEAEAPSPAAIAAAVSNWLSQHPPDQGERGPGPTAQQVAAAVQEYLTLNPPPAGPPGEDGKDGTDGKDGAEGPQGPGPTPEEIAAEVEAYIEEHPLPICPAGSAAEPHTILTTGGSIDAVVCVRQDEPEGDD